MKMGHLLILTLLLVCGVGFVLHECGIGGVFAILSGTVVVLTMAFHWAVSHRYDGITGDIVQLVYVPLAVCLIVGIGVYLKSATKWFDFVPFDLDPHEAVVWAALDSFTVSVLVWLFPIGRRRVLGSGDGISCPDCGYRIDNIPSAQCPECGAPIVRDPVSFSVDGFGAKYRKFAGRARLRPSRVSRRKR